MAKKRDTARYSLSDGQKIVYFGITDDLERRVAQHRAEGLRFTNVRKEGPLVSRESALEWESGRLDTYRRNHGGRSPRYNKQ